MKADQQRWDARWSDQVAESSATASRAPDVLRSNPALLDSLPDGGRALDVACGVGAQTRWLAESGYSVTALDVSPVAIEQVRRTARLERLDVEALVWDTDGGLPSDLTDIAVIVCQRFRAVGLYCELALRLRPGGVLLLTVLSSVDAADHGRFHASPGELTSAFADLAETVPLDVLFDSEADGLASIVVRRSA